MYIVLTGAFKNVGDFLIRERGMKLLQHHRPDRKLVELNRRENLEDHLDLVNSSKGIILLGGPGYQENFYPGIFPLTKNIEDIKVPIIPMGLGWRGQELYAENFSFNESSRNLINKIHEEVEFTSCRDVQTEKVLNMNGYKNVIMTGCPVWYDIPSVGKPLDKPEEIKNIAFSNAQDHRFFGQSVEIVKGLKNLFPNAEIHFVFHRGIGKDQYTDWKEGWRLTRLAKKVEKLGCNVVDGAYDTKNIEFYRECDFHVGYRVHAQIFFLSVRKPTFLIQEDGRGVGLSQSLGLINDVWGRDEDAASKILNNIKNEIPDFKSFADIGDKMDLHYEKMVKFIKSLP